MELLITLTNDKKFKITLPAGARTTFAPWSPPRKGYEINRDNLRGTLRVYNASKDIIAVFSDVLSFRDTSIDYAEEVVKEEGAVVWKSDAKGYYKEEKVKHDVDWNRPQLKGKTKR